MGFDKLYKDNFGQTVPEQSATQDSSVINLNIDTQSRVSMIPQEELVKELKDKGHELGRVADTLYKIPVPIGNSIEYWEYRSDVERDININNFQEHVINISDSICKWNTASSIYGEIIAAKELAYNVWYNRQMYMTRTNNVDNRKLTESALKEIFMVNNYAEYVSKSMELINLKAMKDLIDDAIIKSLFEKSKQLITLGAQLRQEYGTIMVKQ